MVTFDPARREALVAALAAATAPATLVAASGVPAAVCAAPVAASPSPQYEAGMKMRKYQVGDQKGLDSLKLVVGPVPEPGPGEVRIAVKASALNHRDLMVMGGRYGGPKPPTRVPVADGAGEVVAVGAGVTRVKVGDRVTAPHFTPWVDGDYDPSVFAGDVGNSIDGWLQEQVLLPAAALVKLPAKMGYEEAAALGAAGITAWAVLEPFGRMKSGDVVLTLGTGGVAILALQIAKMGGATVAITSSSDTKLAACRELGADITVNYRTTPAWHEAVLAATGGRGADIVVETVGLGTLSQSLACCAPNARVGWLGGLEGPPAGGPTLFPMIAKNVVLKGITSGSRRMLEDLLRAVDGNGVKPKIDKVFPFDQARAALDYLATGTHLGKIVIRH
ncbi:MAG: NAD(P)-dependent alcohol dehydrogenase [Steroidobacteraceae bacterium]|jgi:NADPH:quinone reductase-like Zn-dependent oxidoreductase|nr:NAD(P)-dependent alcohol dehydrogenase [Steroidobacteraceae bacterium]